MPPKLTYIIGFGNSLLSVIYNRPLTKWLQENLPLLHKKISVAFKKRILIELSSFMCLYIYSHIFGYTMKPFFNVLLTLTKIETDFARALFNGFSLNFLKKLCHGSPIASFSK